MHRLAMTALLALATLPACAQQPRPGRALAQACRADYQAHCSHVPRGDGRILACLQEQGERLSAPCRGALAQAGR